jgi:hypothetical protein
MGSDPDLQLTDYYPEWLDNLADNVTPGGSATDGFIQGRRGSADRAGIYPLAL